MKARPRGRGAGDADLGGDQVDGWFGGIGGVYGICGPGARRGPPGVEVPGGRHDPASVVTSRMCGATSTTPSVTFWSAKNFATSAKFAMSAAVIAEVGLPAW